MYCLLLILFPLRYAVVAEQLPIPIVVGTWSNQDFQQAVQNAWNSLASGANRMDALVEGLSTCERLRCDYTVGPGGSPDEGGEVTLDALVMDGRTHNVGAVGGMDRVPDAARVAYAVLKYTRHTLLVGNKASQFAINLGFDYQTHLTSKHSKEIYRKWLSNNCQPNFWKNVQPDPEKQCGPYKPHFILEELFQEEKKTDYEKTNSNQIEAKKSHQWDTGHDTLGLIVVDANGAIAAGASSNGATHKIPGRVGDAPIPGSGAYADEVGAAVATGDGDIMMRFVPSFLAVEYMRTWNYEPRIAAAMAIRRILKFYPNFFGALVAVNRRGEHGAACSGMPTFGYTVKNAPMPSINDNLNFRNDTIVFNVDCISN